MVIVIIQFVLAFIVWAGGINLLLTGGINKNINISKLFKK